ncbi:Hypothetical protein, putative [Bodo saltans]|uniref:Uncharacterized protein n=1 Tax=Bodo saltans TaxID=75058 RepID=A0A0S4JD36_BODSA|nr:Hypothetical protein, putative [Bodo saltans]|eukprot:CUG88043.1 Hypothetical protein, putative [Bodo saltans]
MTSALEVDGLEPDSIEFVEHLIATLVASTTPSASSSSTAASTSLPTPSQRTMASPGSPAMETQQRRASVASSAEGGGGGGVKLPAPPSGSSVPSSRRRATVILDPHDVAAKEQEPSPGLMVVPPTPAFSTRAGAAAPGEPQSPLTAAAAEASTAPPSPSPGANNSGTISLVSDVQTFRLAKFILFDVWLLPMLNNAQRYGLIPPHAPPHLIHNINAFVRYAKILVNAPYTQRNDERDKYKQQQEEQAAAAASMATSGGGAAQPVVVAEVPKQTLSDVDECVPPEYSAALRRSAIPGVISGVYNSSNGTLVQLFRFPQDFLMSQKASSSQNSGSGGNVADGIRKKSPLSASTPSNSRRRPSNNNQQSSSSRRNMTRAISTASARLGLSSGGESSMRKGGRVSSAAFLASSLNSTLMAASDYYVHQNGSVAFPTMAQLSPHLQQLNVAIGVATPSQMTVAVASALPQQRSPSTQPLSSQRSVGSTASSVAAPKSAAQQLEMFCWHASTDEDRHRVVPEFQVPPHIAVTCTENIYKVITGQHPATKVLCKHSNAAATKTGAFGRSPGPSNISPEETPMAQRLSVVSASSDGQSGAAAADGVVKVSKKDKSSEGEPSKDAVDLYLRCLHSVLLHPTTAGQALDCMSVNHRKLFQQLMRVPAAASHASTLGVSLTSDATSLACSLYPYLLVGVRDQPLVDVNAIAMLTSASLVTQSHIPLPSAFIQARRRLLARQLFLTTGARIGNFVNPAQSAATTNNNNAGIADDPSGDSPTHPTSPTRSSRRRSSRSITIGQPDMRPRGLGDDPEDGPIPQPLFAAWWCYMAAALCAKAECALEESSAFLSKRWERRCRQTMRRYSHRDSVAEATFSSNTNNNNAKTSRGGKGATKTTMKEKTKLLLPKLTSTVASKSHKDGAGDAASVASGGIGGGGGGGGGGLLAPTSRFGGGGTDASFDPPNTARRLSTSSTVVVRKNAGGSGINNPLMQRWREAVTDSVDRSEGDRGDTVSNSNSSRPSRAPSVSLETPRMVPRAPARQR